MPPTLLTIPKKITVCGSKQMIKIKLEIKELLSGIVINSIVC